MSAVILGAVEPMVFRPTVRAATGREILDHKLLNLAGTPGAERTVPPVVPSFDEPCPDCDGAGWWFYAHGRSRLTCSTCNGSGVVQRVWAAERQNDMGLGWQPYERIVGPEHLYGTRLAVVAWHPITVLPVVDFDEVSEDQPAPFIAVVDDGRVFMFDTDYWLLRAPWAADLTPGCVVVIPGDEVRLAEPITKMRVECDADWSPCDEGICISNPCGMPVPQALEDGLNVVVLAR